MKTAEYYLIIALEESGINTTDDIDAKLLNAMEEYANQFKSSHASTEP